MNKKTFKIKKKLKKIKSKKKLLGGANDISKKFPKITGKLKNTAEKAKAKVAEKVQSGEAAETVASQVKEKLEEQTPGLVSLFETSKKMSPDNNVSISDFTNTAKEKAKKTDLGKLLGHQYVTVKAPESQIKVQHSLDLNELEDRFGIVKDQSEEYLKKLKENMPTIDISDLKGNLPDSLFLWDMVKHAIMCMNIFSPFCPGCFGDDIAELSKMVSQIGNRIRETIIEIYQMKDDDISPEEMKVVMFFEVSNILCLQKDLLFKISDKLAETVKNIKDNPVLHELNIIGNNILDKIVDVSENFRMIADRICIIRDKLYNIYRSVRPSHKERAKLQNMQCSLKDMSSEEESKNMAEKEAREIQKKETLLLDKINQEKEILAAKTAEMEKLERELSSLKTKKPKKSEPGEKKGQSTGELSSSSEQIELPSTEEQIVPEGGKLKIKKKFKSRKLRNRRYKNK